MDRSKRIHNYFYKKFVGAYAKRFYTPFEKENIAKISGFKLKDGVAHFAMEDAVRVWYWDVEDCIIIVNNKTNKFTEIDMEDERVADINHPRYLGWNPYENTSFPKKERIRMLNKLISIAENSENHHDLEDCSQPSSSFPDYFHRKDCKFCKELEEMKKWLKEIENE